MLRLCMSGAGVAFPVQLISSPRHSVSILCYSSALHCTSSPRLCPASPLLCSPCPCLSVPIRRVAVPGQAWRFPCKSWHIYALAAQGFAFPARCGYKHCRSYASQGVSSASLVQAFPVRNVALLFRGISLLCTAPLCPCQAKQCQCLVLLFYSQAAHLASRQCLFVSGPLSARLFRRLSARTIACADISPW